MTTPGSAPGCPVRESFDPLAPDFLTDPYAVLAGLPRDEQPIFFAPSIGWPPTAGTCGIWSRPRRPSPVTT